MGVFSKKIVVFLTQNGLVFYKVKKKESLRLLFPAEITSYQEILNEKKFEELISGFLAQFSEKEKKDVIIILSSNLVYSKVISKTAEKEKTKSEEEFIRSLPLAKSRVIIKTVPMGKDEIIFATNRSFYEFVVNVFINAGFKVPIVASITLFTNSPINKELSETLLNEIRKESKALVVGNFLSDENELEGIEDTSDKSEDEEDGDVKAHLPIKQYFLLFVSIAILIGALLYVLLSLGVIKNPLGGSNSIATQSASLSSAPSPSPTISSETESALNSASPSAPLTKETVRIQILNGSGIEGQAGSIRSLFIAEGFNEIETGNAEDIKEITVIQFAKNVPDELQKDIASIVEKVSPNPDVKKNEILKNYDIIITTGRE